MDLAEFKERYKFYKKDQLLEFCWRNQETISGLRKQLDDMRIKMEGAQAQIDKQAKIVAEFDKLRDSIMSCFSGEIRRIAKEEAQEICGEAIDDYDRSEKESAYEASLGYDA